MGRGCRNGRRPAACPVGNDPIQTAPNVTRATPRGRPSGRTGRSRPTQGSAASSRQRHVRCFQRAGPGWGGRRLRQIARSGRRFTRSGSGCTAPANGNPRAVVPRSRALQEGWHPRRHGRVRLFGTERPPVDRPGTEGTTPVNPEVPLVLLVEPSRFSLTRHDAKEDQGPALPPGLVIVKNCD